MLGKMDFATFPSRQERYQMDNLVRVLKIDRRQTGMNLYIDGKLLANLTDKACPWSFAYFNFASGKLPLARQIHRIRTLRCQNFSLMSDKGAGDGDDLHGQGLDTCPKLGFIPIFSSNSGFPR